MSSPPAIPAHVLIVDDEAATAEALAALLAAELFSVAIAGSLAEARRQIRLRKPDVVLLDLQLPDGDGLDLIADAELPDGCRVALITGYASIETSVRALRLGAVDCLVKPIAREPLLAALDRLIAIRPAAGRDKAAEMARILDEEGRFGRLQGRSTAMRLIYRQIARVAQTGVTVFVTGESGTGKEMVAQTVHDLSRRSAQPFLAVNCGGISPNLMESEIFGHEKGSFTGADRQHRGFFEQASGGTLFLDEVTEMPVELQVKLLQVLETGRYMRVGSTQPLEADVRVIAASNRVPAQAVAEGRLREDLFYRLNVFPLELPPLRERLDDVLPLALHFLALMGAGEGEAKHFGPKALHQLGRGHWRGNVRELRNVVQRSYVMCSGPVIDALWIVPPAARAPAAPAPEPLTVHADSIVLRPGCSVAEAERALVVMTLRHFEHHKERAAAALGISIKTLYSRLKDYAGERGPARGE